MLRYFDWLATRQIPDWTYYVSTLGSAVAFGVIFGIIVASGAGLIP